MVETTRLESGHTCKGIVGSNPTLSAILLLHTLSPAFDSIFSICPSKTSLPVVLADSDQN